MKNSNNNKKTKIHQEIDGVKSNHSETRQENDAWKLELQTIDYSEAQYFQGGIARTSGSRTNAEVIVLPCDYSQLSTIIEQ